MTDWQQLSTAVEEAFRAALRELGSQRRFTTNNYKGRVAAAIPVCSHHKPSPEGLRRLGRRIEQWHKHADHQPSGHVLREAACFLCPLDPLDPNTLPATRQWLQAELTSLETARKDRRLQEWKRSMQQQDGRVWRWLAKANKTEVISGLRNAQGSVLTPAQTMAPSAALRRRRTSST